MKRAKKSLTTEEKKQKKHKYQNRKIRNQNKQEKINTQLNREQKMGKNKVETKRTQSKIQENGNLDTQ